MNWHHHSILLKPISNQTRNVGIQPHKRVSKIFNQETSLLNSRINLKCLVAIPQAVLREKLETVILDKMMMLNHRDKILKAMKMLVLVQRLAQSDQ